MLLAPDFIALVVAFFLVAVLYSSVGHAGASGYLAVMALASVAPEQMKLTALLLNLVVAGIASLNFVRAGNLSWALTWPCMVTSVPCASIGGAIVLPSGAFKVAVALALLFAASRLGFYRQTGVKTLTQPSRHVLFGVGAVLGLMAGLTGTGGGIFLSPILVLMGWATLAGSSASSALFILVNSAAGLLGQLLTSKGFAVLEQRLLLSCAGAVLVGGFIGSRAGARLLPPVWTRRLLAIVLCTASAKLFYSALGY